MGRVFVAACSAPSPPRCSGEGAERAKHARGATLRRPEPAMDQATPVFFASGPSPDPWGREAKNTAGTSIKRREQPTEKPEEPFFYPCATSSHVVTRSGTGGSRSQRSVIACRRRRTLNALGTRAIVAKLSGDDRHSRLGGQRDALATFEDLLTQCTLYERPHVSGIS